LENAIKILSSKNVDLYNQHDMTRPGRKHTGDRRNTQKDTGDRLTHRRQIDTQETDVEHKETVYKTRRQMWTFWAPCACAARIAMRPTGPQPMTAAEVASSGNS
jgi:hypothetical protein